MSYSDLTERKVTLMTVKEVEQLTGMPRADIRYYEKQGLLEQTSRNFLFGS